MSKKSPPYLLPSNFPAHAPLPPGGPWIRPQDVQQQDTRQGVDEQIQLARHRPAGGSEPAPSYGVAPHSVPMAPLVAATEEDWEDEPTLEMAPIGTGQRHPSWRAREAMDTLVDTDDDDSQDDDGARDDDSRDANDSRPANDVRYADDLQESPPDPRSSGTHPLTLGLGLAPALTPLSMVEAQAAQRRKRSA